MSVFATIYQRLSESTELPWRALLLGVFVVGGLMISVGKETDDENGWHTLYWYGAMLILTAQMSHTTRAFFMGEGTAPWLSVVPWQRQPRCPGRVGCSTHPCGQAARGALLSVCHTPRRPCRAHCPGPSIWDFGRYFLALDGDLKTVQQKAPLVTRSRPHSPQTLAPLSHRPAFTRRLTLTPPKGQPAPHAHPAPAHAHPAPFRSGATRRPSRTRPLASAWAS